MATTKSLKRVGLGIEGILHNGKVSLDQTISLNSKNLPRLVIGERCILIDNQSLDSYEGVILMATQKKTYVKIVSPYTGGEGI